MFSLRDYGDIIRDPIRTGAYVEALRQGISPDSVVLDIGAGTGVLALVAARLGARRVFAVETQDAIEVAREIASANGLDGRIDFIQALSTEIELPEPADVVVADLHGVLPLFQGSLRALVDARKRHLAPGGRMIPARERLWASLVAAPGPYSRLVAPWREGPLGIDMSTALPRLVNDFYRTRLEPADLLSDPACFKTLDYAVLDGPDLDCEFSIAARRSGEAHGLAVWFDSTLAEGVEISNAPGAPKLIFGNAFFPWPAPVRVEEGDAIAVAMRAKLLGDRYLWSWDSRIEGAGAERASFRQSQFFSTPLAPSNLRRQAAGHVPRLNERGLIDRLILERMGERRPLGDIAREIAAQFPRRFADWKDALTHIAEVSARCSD